MIVREIPVATTHGGDVPARCVTRRQRMPFFASPVTVPLVQVVAVEVLLAATSMSLAFHSISHTLGNSEVPVANLYVRLEVVVFFVLRVLRVGERTGTNLRLLNCEWALQSIVQSVVSHTL